jgi:hypothetical protein
MAPRADGEGDVVGFKWAWLVIAGELYPADILALVEKTENEIFVSAYILKSQRMATFAVVAGQGSVAGRALPDANLISVLQIHVLGVN